MVLESNSEIVITKKSLEIFVDKIGFVDSVLLGLGGPTFINSYLDFPSYVIGIIVYHSAGSGL